ncbi:hypothetical protein OAS39_02510 [Pirellulales bacterium]|nr:hypothetical protein [Pirellulales bacterium]
MTSIIAAACVFAVALAAPRAAADATLRLTTGDFVGGQLLPLAEGNRIRWRSSVTATPLEFSLDAIAAVDFEAAPKSDKNLLPEYCFELAEGDVLFGRLVSLSAQECVIDSNRFGQLTLARNALRQISRWGEGDNLVYLGPDRLDHWKMLTPERPWREQNGHLIADEPRSSIYGDVNNLPERAAIEIELSWTKPPDFAIELGVSDDADKVSHPFRLEVWDELVMLIRDGLDKGDLTWLRDEPAMSGRLHVQLLLDRKKGRLLAYTPAGKPLAKLEVPSRKLVGDRVGIRISNRRGDVRLERLRITRWDGKTPQPIDQDGPRLQMQDGSLRYGDIHFREDANVFVVGRGNEAETFPSNDVRTIAFPSEPRDDNRDQRDRSLRVLLQGGSHLSGKLAGVAEGALLLIHPHAPAPVRLPLDQLSALVVISREEQDLEKQLATLGPIGRLEAEGIQLHGVLVDSSDQDQPLVFQPRGSMNASALHPRVSGRIVYRDPPPQPKRSAQPAPIQPQQRGLLNGLVRAFSGNGERPAPRTAITTSIHLRSGDVVPCRVTAIDGRGVHMNTPNFDASLVPHDRIKAAVLWGGEPSRIARRAQTRTASDVAAHAKGQSAHAPALQ